MCALLLLIFELLKAEPLATVVEDSCSTLTRTMLMLQSFRRQCETIVTVTMIHDTGINQWMNLPSLRHAAHHVASWCSYAVVVIWAVSIYEIARQTDTAILTKVEQHTFGPLTMTPVLVMCSGMTMETTVGLFEWWCTGQNSSTSLEGSARQLLK